MQYQIFRTAKADEQIRDIIFYRAELTEKNSAIELLNKLAKGINQLSDFPESGALPRFGSLRARGFRVIIVDKFLIFYKVNHNKKTITIYTAVDGRRDYLNLI